MRKNLITFFLLALPLYGLSQILPKEGSGLNYRLIGFSFPKERTSGQYKIEVARGNYKNATAFKKNIILSQKTINTKIMIEVPSFGEEYTWHVVYDSAKKKESPLYHFTTVRNDRVDTTKYRLRILQPSNDYKDMFVAIDGGGVFHDMNGNAVAYFPDVTEIGGFMADIDFTHQGTMTVMYIRTAYEVNLNGDILWKTPDYNAVNGGGEPDTYHHNFSKLSNGHYMVLGREYLPSRVITTKDSSYIVFSGEKTATEGYKMGIYGTIMEFDKDGKVVWSWKDSEHLNSTDFAYYTYPLDTNLRFDPHSNSFFFDEKNGFVYISYRNMSRIIKIDYHTREIVAIYGENFKPGVKSVGAGLFCNPHGVKRSDNGNLYFFNNNSCNNTDSLPTVVVLKEPANAGDPLEKIWEYTCTVEGNYPKKFGAGGSVIEMPDKSMFVCMGNEYSKLFVVTPNKKITWSALPERHVETDNIWVNVKQYRANIIDRRGLEQLIWTAEAAVKTK